jgi:hypothetical protein
MWSDIIIWLLLIWIWCWDYPANKPLQKVATLISRPFLWLGLWHSWAMFAPEPIRVNRRLKATIHYCNGAVDEWRPIEPRRSNWFLDLLWFRHFKYQFSVLSGTNKVLWKPLCDWLFRHAERDGQQVEFVQLTREYQIVQPPAVDPPLTDWKAVVVHQQAAAAGRVQADEIVPGSAGA